MPLELSTMLCRHLEAALDALQADPYLQEDDDHSAINFSGLGKESSINDITITESSCGKFIVTSVIISTGNNLERLFTDARLHPLVEPLSSKVLSDMKMAIEIAEPTSPDLLCDFIDRDAESGFTFIKTNGTYQMGFILAMQPTKFRSLTAAYLRLSACSFIHPN